MRQIGDVVPGVMKGVKVYPFRPGEFFTEARWLTERLADIGGPTAFCVRAWIKAHSNGRGCLSSARRISVAMNLHRSSVSGALKALEKKGLVTKERHKTGLYLFKAVDPPPCPQKGA